MNLRADWLKTRAHERGFPIVGIAAATEADGFARYREWLDRGFAGDMNYLHHQREARRSPTHLLADVRSVVMLACEYGDLPDHPAFVAAEPNRAAGKVARYASKVDYHAVLRERLNALLGDVRSEWPGVEGRGVVDSAPLLERDFARRAGLGFIGKNTLLIHKQRGSYLLLAALLLTVELPPDPPQTTQHCGTCTRCLDACPTDAFAGPGWLDARKCISYLTIELKTAVPEELRPGVGDWLFGCDVCQEVCPWNRHATGDALALDAAELLTLDEAAFRLRFRGTPLFRTKRRGVLRNAALVLANGDEREALQRAANDPEPLVREAAMWGLTQMSDAPRGRAVSPPRKRGKN